MASIKLTKGMRDDVVDSVLRHKFGPLEKKLEEEQYKLAEKAYNLVFSKKERELMESLPKGWLRTDDDINIRLPGYCHVRLQFSPHKHGLGKDKDRVYKRFPYESGSSFNPEVGSKLADLAQAYLDKKDKLQQEKREARNAAEALMNSVTTVNRAIEVWPAAETFIKDAVGVHGKYQKSNAPLPVVMVEDLNKKLGLPPKEKAA